MQIGRETLQTEQILGERFEMGSSATFKRRIRAQSIQRVLSSLVMVVKEF